MVKLPNATISEKTQIALGKYQAEIDGLPYADQVAKAALIWPSRKLNQPFQEVLEKLIEMCAGAQRCCYCEDSMADEIEHIAPKIFFPQRTFEWENYLYACGPCNGPKSNRFPVFSRSNRAILELAHPPSGPVPPEDGDPLLLNPRIEDPTQWLMLSIDKDGRRLDFLPIAQDKFSEAYLRAAYTIQVLRLNERTKLGEARMEAYTSYRSRLSEYVSKSWQGPDEVAMARIKKELLRAAHPTVWREIVRYRQKGWLQSVDPEFDAYFDAVPEATPWQP